jgi:hypothetical protein
LKSPCLAKELYSENEELEYFGILFGTMIANLSEAVAIALNYLRCRSLENCKNGKYENGLRVDAKNHAHEWH